MRDSRILPSVGIAAGTVLVLAGCGSAATEPADSDDTITVVASTNVYGQIAEQIGGDAVTVTSIIDSSAQDPHEYEGSAQDQLVVSEADIIIENGGGYDAFVDAMIESSGSEAHVITAVEYSHDYPGEEAEHDHSEEEEAEEEAAEEEEHEHEHIEGFNEHVWYDPHTMEHVAEAIAEELSEHDPEQAETYEANLAAFVEEIATIEDDLAAVA